jgi:hemerythrin-like domain-containing protein
MVNILKSREQGRVLMPANSRSKNSKITRKKNGSSEDAISMLKSDHTQVKRLLKQLSKTEEDAADERKELLARIETELKAHTQIEEEIFYPQFRDAAGDSDAHLYFEAVEEHGLVDIVLPEMKETDSSSEEFAAKAKVLLDLVEHHIEEEEDQMFPKAKRALGKTTLQELGEQMKARKDALLGGMAEEEEEEMSPRGGRRRRAA